MAMVGVVLWQPLQADSQRKSSGLVLGRRPLGAVLNSSNEPGELSQWLCHDDSTINIILDIIIILLLLLYVFPRAAVSAFYELSCSISVVFLSNCIMCFCKQNK